MIYVVGHKNPDTDSVVAAYAYAKFKGDNFVPAVLGELNNETKFIFEKFGVTPPALLPSIKEEDRFILVDHNEVTQIADGMKVEQIVEILDHHKFNIATSSPIWIIVKPYGSTASLVTERFLEEKIVIDQKLAGLLLSAILSDTIIFKSPTTTEKDKEFASTLSNISGITDIKEYGIELFKKKSEMASKTPAQIINNDFKDFDFKGKKIGIGQVELIDANDISHKKNDIISEMESMKNSGSYFAIILIVTDIMREGSFFWVAGDKDCVYDVLEINEENNYKEGVLSRKKQVVPILEKKL